MEVTLILPEPLPAGTHKLVLGGSTGGEGGGTTPPDTGAGPNGIPTRWANDHAQARDDIVQWQFDHADSFPWCLTFNGAQIGYPGAAPSVDFTTAIEQGFGVYSGRGIIPVGAGQPTPVPPVETVPPPSGGASVDVFIGWPKQADQKRTPQITTQIIRLAAGTVPPNHPITQSGGDLGLLAAVQELGNWAYNWQISIGGVVVVPWAAENFSTTVFFRLAVGDKVMTDINVPPGQSYEVLLKHQYGNAGHNICRISPPK